MADSSPELLKSALGTERTRTLQQPEGHTRVKGQGSFQELPSSTFHSVQSASNLVAASPASIPEPLSQQPEGNMQTCPPIFYPYPAGESYSLPPLRFPVQVSPALQTPMLVTASRHSQQMPAPVFLPRGLRPLGRASLSGPSCSLEPLALLSGASVLLLTPQHLFCV